jgi:predicted PurR-regulated permease PerM
MLSGFGPGLSHLADFLLAPVLAYYFLKEWERLKGWILHLFSVSFQGDLVFVGGEIRQIVMAFIRGNLLTSCVVGLLTYLGLKILGLEYAGIMAALAGLGNLIPYFGVLFSSAPVILLGLLQAPWKAAAALVMVTLIQQLEGDVLTPRILGASLGLPPLAIILSLLAAGKFFGVFGMFLAAPMAAVIKVIVRRVMARLV